MTARDLFTNNPREKPAAEVQSQDRQSNERVLGQEEREPLAPPASSGTCGACGHGSVSRFSMIACGLVRSKASVNHPDLPCQIGRWTQITADVAARREAQAGIDQAVAAADRAVPEWSDIALQFVRLFATQNKGKQYIGHDIVRASIAAGIVQPPNPKAWGGPIQRAARAGYIRKVGTAPDPNRHTNPVPLWESGEPEALEAA